MNSSGKMPHYQQQQDNMIPQALDAISFNNSAVRSLEEDEVSSACEFIAIAIKIVQNDNELKRQSPSSSQNEPSSKYYNFQWAENSSLPTEINKADESVGYFLFTRGMYISTLRRDNHNNKRARYSHHLNSDVGAAISYNAGLIFQLFAIKRRSYTLLDKAGNFYRQSQAILRKANERGVKSKLCFKFFFHVPLLNNLGQLCYELVDYQSCSYYFDRIHENLEHLIERLNCPDTSQQKNVKIYHRTDLLNMLSNTIVDIPVTSPAA